MNITNIYIELYLEVPYLNNLCFSYIVSYSVHLYCIYYKKGGKVI